VCLGRTVEDVRQVIVEIAMVQMAVRVDQFQSVLKLSNGAGRVPRRTIKS
jgi:hypothetical protein